jgi:hypothetical protein
VGERLTVEDLATIRHEAAHAVAGYLLLGRKSVRRVTRVPNGNLTGCASFDLPDLSDFPDPDLLRRKALECAVVLSVPQLISTAARGHGRDIERAYQCQSIAYRYAGTVEDVGEWVEAWEYAKWRRVDELTAKRSGFWIGVKAVERQLDCWPTLSGDVVRSVLDKVYAGASSAARLRRAGNPVTMIPRRSQAAA